MIVLDKDQSFSMQANVTTPGYQRVMLRGYLMETRGSGTYVAPLIPQLFYGADGSQLQTWRQYIGGTGQQTILSRRAGGYPEVPREELFWQKISDDNTLKTTDVAPKQEPGGFDFMVLLPVATTLIGGYAGYKYGEVTGGFLGGFSGFFIGKYLYDKYLESILP